MISVFSSTLHAGLPKETSDNANNLTTVLPLDEAELKKRGGVELKNIQSCLKVASDERHVVSECTNEPLRVFSHLIVR